jgi:hypothetical protein
MIDVPAKRFIWKKRVGREGLGRIRRDQQVEDFASFGTMVEGGWTKYNSHVLGTE